MDPLIPPDETIYPQHAHQVEELIASRQAVGSSQEVSVEGIVIQLGRGKTHGHAYDCGDCLRDGKYLS